MSCGKVFLIAGKICSGKTTYAKALCEKENGVLLSCDEVLFALFDGNLGDRHDEIASRLEGYFLSKSIELVIAGTSVVLDWGFWQSKKRDSVREFYKSHNVDFEFHYIDVTDENWEKNINERNEKVKNGKDKASYYVDEGLKEKLLRLFEAPDKSEIDVWVENKRDLNFEVNSYENPEAD